MESVFGVFYCRFDVFMASDRDVVENNSIVLGISKAIRLFALAGDVLSIQEQLRVELRIQAGATHRCVLLLSFDKVAVLVNSKRFRCKEVLVSFS